MTKQTKAELVLVFITLCWGVSFYMVDVCLTEMGPLTLNAYRFILAFCAAYVLAFPKVRKVNKITIRYSVFSALALTVTYIGATYGILYTSLSNAGFLCATTVVFTPLFVFIIYRKVPEKKLVAVVLICVTGVALMSLNEQMQPALGDLLCLGCAASYGVNLIIIEAAVKRDDVDAFQLGVFQLLWTGALNLLCAFLFEKPNIPESTAVWIFFFFLAIFCTGVAFILQAVTLRYTTASRAGVIFTLDPLFAGIVAYVFAGEVLLPRAYVGAVLLLVGILVMELDLKSFKK